MSDLMNEWIKKMNDMNEWIIDWLNERLNEWMDECIDE